mmetsp:Transcript_39593/g.33443  ORF Transcript_39593/g.33443 Transcript_39593/m.33443 type:complete len:118 (+) Transcript_39593:323-676(+)
MHIETIGKPINIKVAMICGGISESNQLTELEMLPHIIIATPGRLASFLKNYVSTNLNMGYVRDYFKRISCIVLDEADRLLDEQSIKEDVNYILDCCSNRQFQFFNSATENEFLNKLK